MVTPPPFSPPSFLVFLSSPPLSYFLLIHPPVHAATRLRTFTCPSSVSEPAHPFERFHNTSPPPFPRIPIKWELQSEKQRTFFNPTPPLFFFFLFSTHPLCFHIKRFTDLDRPDILYVSSYPRRLRRSSHSSLGTPAPFFVFYF